MELQIGDRLADETGEWEVIGQPYTTAGGKTARVRVQRRWPESNCCNSTWRGSAAARKRPVMFFPVVARALPTPRDARRRSFFTACNLRRVFFGTPFTVRSRPLTFSIPLYLADALLITEDRRSVGEELNEAGPTSPWPRPAARPRGESTHYLAHKPSTHDGGHFMNAHTSDDKTVGTVATMTAAAQELGATTATKANEAAAVVGEKIGSLATVIRENAPHEGAMATAASAVAGGLESASSYLQEKKFDALAHQVTNLVRTYPVQSLLLGVGLGYLLARRSR
jgi:hypothetical protein